MNLVVGIDIVPTFLIIVALYICFFAFICWLFGHNIFFSFTCWSFIAIFVSHLFVLNQWIEDFKSSYKHIECWWVKEFFSRFRHFILSLTVFYEPNYWLRIYYCSNKVGNNVRHRQTARYKTKTKTNFYVISLTSIRTNSHSLQHVNFDFKQIRGKLLRSPLAFPVKEFTLIFSLPFPKYYLAKIFLYFWDFRISNLKHSK